MPPINKVLITGTAGGEAGMFNVGNSADNTWATSGNPTFATTGLKQQNGDDGGTSAINITVAANRGTLTPWSPSDPKPAGMTGPSFVRMPAAHTNIAFTLMSDAISTAMNSTATDGASQAEQDFEAGYLFTAWLRLFCEPSTIQHTAEPTITPPHNPGEQAIHDVQTSAGGSFGQLRTDIRNLAGFRPAFTIANGNYVSQGQDVLPISGGGGSSLPLGHISANEWLPVQVWIRRATGPAANDGEIRWYVGGALVMRTTGVGVWYASNSWRMQYFAGLFAGYAAARTGVQLDFGCPLKLQVVSEADLPTAIISNWQRNTELKLDLRRHWPVMAPVHPIKVTTVSGSPTAPTFGRVVNTGGVNPGVCELPLGGPANAEQMVEFPAVWDGVTANPFGEDGWVYISLDTCNPQGSRVAWRVRNAADSANLLECVLDDSGTGSFEVNGVQILSGRTRLPAHTRWQPVLALHQSSGEARVALAEISTPTFTVRSLEWFDAATTYVGGAIGKPQASVRNLNGATGRVGGCSVMAENSWVLGDSFSGDSMLVNSYAISGINQGTKTATVASMQSGSAKSRKPVPGDQVPITGSTGNNGWYTVVAASDTTIQFAEALPSATADGVVEISAPGLVSNANRLAQTIPSRDAASAIAPHYIRAHPLLTGPFRGFHCLFNLARSGQSLSQLITTVLPGCAKSPPMKALAMCFDVNDTTNTTTRSAMFAQAAALAANKKLLADWIAARGGLLIHAASYNGENGAGILGGWAAQWRRVTMAQTYEIFRNLVLNDRTLDGHVVLVDPSKYLAAGSLRMSGDTLHPDNSSALEFVTGIFLGYEALSLLPGFYPDGSMVVPARNGGFGPVLPPVF